MVGQSQHDSWSAGNNYDQYMGRWSRKVAVKFLDWLAANDGGHWVEAGCGTGALSKEILTRCAPQRLLGVDPSEDFVLQAQKNIPDKRAEFRVGDAQALPVEDSSCDFVASALVLNFVPDKPLAVREMQRVTRPGGTIGFYVWDYPNDGVEFMQAFWNAAIELDPQAAELAEGRRFPFCTPDGLHEIVRDTGLRDVESVDVTVETNFQNFEDFWLPFTLGTGPAPGYCAGLDVTARENLRARLQSQLAPDSASSIELKARAWALKGKAASGRHPPNRR